MVIVILVEIQDEVLEVIVILVEIQDEVLIVTEVVNKK
jgi:hypothetical protein